MDNITKIQKALQEFGLDAIMLTDEADRLYATGFRATDGLAVVTREKAWFLTDSRYIEAAENTVAGAEVGLVTAQTRYTDWLLKIVGEAPVKVLGIQEESMSCGEYLRWEKELPCELKPAQKLMNSLRRSKSRTELEKMISAQRIAERAFDEVLGLLRPGVTEKEIAAELIYRFLKYGAEGVSFDPIVVFGPKTSMPHGVPGDRKLEYGDFVTLDFGCVKDGYCSDTTRTVAVGVVTDEMRRVYEVVLEAQLRGIEAAKPGVPGCQVDMAARRVIEDAGFGEYFGHSFGHSLGLRIHETPNASPSEKEPLPEGAVISAEPGIYLPGKFGVRIEDVLYLTGAGNENITRLPKQLLIL